MAGIYILVQEAPELISLPRHPAVSCLLTRHHATELHTRRVQRRNRAPGRGFWRQGHLNEALKDGEAGDSGARSLPFLLEPSGSQAPVFVL